MSTTIAILLISAVILISYELFAATGRRWGENTPSFLSYIKTRFSKAFKWPHGY